jgi:brefeldin A-inhibited guanine nucleotide-exchange protein
MLNTDAHSPQIKKNRMTKAEFIKNNRGINNGQDLPEELLTTIYDEIVSNEIRMKDEVEANPGVATPSGGLAGALSYVGRDLQREAYVAQSEGMATKTEAMFRTMVKSQRRGTQKMGGDVFFSASHTEHVRPMFEVVWMPLLAGISGPMQDTEDSQVIERSLDGFRQAIKIVCLFDLELERSAFVSTLHKFTLLNDFSAMRPKNVEAIRCLLEIAAINGNYLKSSWREVIVCVSQLERFQLITRGVDSGAVPEIGRKQ